MASNSNSISNSMQSSLSRPQQPIHALRVETTTWHRDSHDLFDYEARHVNTKRFCLCRSGKLFREGTEVTCVGDGVIPQSADYLLSIKSCRDGKYLVIPADRNFGGQGSQLIPKKLWMIVREQNNNKHILQENDIIKLGRFKLRVKQLVKSGDNIPELRLENTGPPVIFATTEEMKLMQCRICLLEGNLENDPLICPCDCRGSIKFVHVDCLRRWIQGRLNLPEDMKSSYFFKQIQCELCKTAFPSIVLLNNERIQVIKVPATEPPFIVLENLVGNNQKGVHVISMSEKKDLKLGRGHESDVRIPDVSISRFHATIRFVEGCSSPSFFQLEDHNSKFGTLVAMRKAHPIGLMDDISLQVGRSVVKFSIEESPLPSELVDPIDITGTISDSTLSRRLTSSPSTARLQSHSSKSVNEDVAENRINISSSLVQTFPGLHETNIRENDVCANTPDIDTHRECVETAGSIIYPELSSSQHSLLRALSVSQCLSNQVQGRWLSSQLAGQQQMSCMLDQTRNTIEPSYLNLLDPYNNFVTTSDMISFLKSLPPNISNCYSSSYSRAMSFPNTSGCTYTCLSNANQWWSTHTNDLSNSQSVNSNAEANQINTSSNILDAPEIIENDPIDISGPCFVSDANNISACDIVDESNDPCSPGVSENTLDNSLIST